MEAAKTRLAIGALNHIMELELAGVVRYTHYSLMVYGYNRIPIVSWLKGNAQEGLDHAHRAGELVTLLGGHPSLKIGALLETEQHDIGDILRESLAHEKAALGAYQAAEILFLIRCAEKFDRSKRPASDFLEPGKG
jgi:bacterioferritin